MASKLWLDKYGWPIETWKNRPIQSRIRIFCQWLRGNWFGGRLNFNHPEWVPKVQTYMSGVDTLNCAPSAEREKGK